MELIDASVLTWGFLAAAILFTFFDTNQRRWLWPLFACIASAIYFQQLALIGVFWLALAVALSMGIKHSKLGWRRNIMIVAITVWMLALAAHVLPGFNNLLVLDDVKVSELGIGFTLFLNIDKPFLVFVLLLFVPTLIKSTHDIAPIKSSSLKAQSGQLLSPELSEFLIKIGLIIALFILVFALAVGFELIQPDVKVPTWWWLFAFNNLLFTCVAEEAFFRGFVQQSLTKKYGAVIALGITSMLFGVAHFAGGVAYVGVATIAGLLYGLSHYWWRNLYVPILLHFAVNMVHLLFFTYPMLA